MARKSLNFEQSIGRLQEIVTALERGEAPLAESLKLFEEGTKLVASCTELLDQAEQQVVKLVKSADGTPCEEAFAKADEDA